MFTHINYASGACDCLHCNMSNAILNRTRFRGGMRICTTGIIILVYVGIILIGLFTK